MVKKFSKYKKETDMFLEEIDLLNSFSYKLKKIMDSKLSVVKEEIEQYQQENSSDNVKYCAAKLAEIEKDLFESFSKLEEVVDLLSEIK